MTGGTFYKEEIEQLPRGDLDALVDERVRYTVKYAAEHSPFYQRWFAEHTIDPGAIREHEDLLALPVISGQSIRENQPPVTSGFLFRSVGWESIFTIHETSGTSGTPKSFFLTWADWQRYAEKYARIFVSQGLGSGDRVVICASYGMNVGANTMTLAAKEIGMTVIPTGKCSFPPRVFSAYRPTAIVGSVFKLLRLARRMESEGMPPKESSVERLIVGGESFADESRNYLGEVWDREVFNTYGSTEGTMCGECHTRAGLHVPEDLVHLDVYDPHRDTFVPEGECGRIVLTTLLAPGEHCGTLLLNYDTEDTTVVISRDRCSCGRTHMRIMNPQREAETIWVAGTPFNRVDIERGVFQRDNMDLVTGEYEAFVAPGDEEGEVVLQVSMEYQDPAGPGWRGVEERFRASFFRYKKRLEDAEEDGLFRIEYRFVRPGGLEMSSSKGRPRRLIDRR